MEEYGIDGVFLQRFGVSVKEPRRSLIQRAGWSKSTWAYVGDDVRSLGNATRCDRKAGNGRLETTGGSHEDPRRSGLFAPRG